VILILVAGIEYEALLDVSTTMLEKPPPLAVAAIVIDPAPLVIEIPEPCVNVVREKPVPFPMSMAPFAGVDVKPVPPPKIPKVPNPGAELPAETSA
jgi:hypothetical protein